MNKREYYLKALAAGTFLTTAWNIACFGLIAESPDDWKQNAYPYRLVQMPNGYYYVNPELTTELLQIEGTVGGKPLFARDELIHLDVGDSQNVYKQVETTYGNVLANQILLVYAFGNKIPFMTGRINIKKIEVVIEQRLVDTAVGNKLVVAGDTPLAPVETEPTKAPITVEEYLRFANGAFSLVAYTQLFTPADTRKTLTQPPGVIELRNKLLKENEGHLHDRSVIASISAKLQAFDAEYMKGDRGLDFLITEKSLKTVRSRLMLMYGAETGIEEKIDVDLIQKSLAEGWDVDKFPEMNNALRAGSYNRGKQTELGGAAVKEIFRAAGNLAMSSPDCGSVLGLPTVMPAEDSDRLIGFTAIEEGGLVKITHDNVSSYVDKLIQLRTPMTCKNNLTDYCAICLGDRLANNPTGMAMAVVDYGSVFLAVLMSAAHSKPMTVAKLSLKDVLL